MIFIRDKVVLMLVTNNGVTGDFYDGDKYQHLALSYNFLKEKLFKNN